jgi:FkbH-like protein
MTTTEAKPDREVIEAAIAVHLERASETEVPAAEVCVDLARAYLDAGDHEQALMWCRRVVDAGLDYRAWDAAARILKRIRREHRFQANRTAKLAVLGSYTTDQLVDLLGLVAVRRGIDLEIYQAGYGQYQQEILDPDSRLHSFGPDLVLVAVHDRDLSLPGFTNDPAEAVKAEVERWTSLWGLVESRIGAKVIQTNFVARPEDPFGHLSSRLPGSRRSMVAAVNTGLGAAAGQNVAILDCDYLASLQGRDSWFDDRYWYRSKQAVGFDALPLLATHLMSLVAAEVGLSRKCLVLDLDGTLWGGIIGEDGLEGIGLGHGPDGEAFTAFQDYIVALKNRGVILAACSKNDEAAAKSPFESHPDMRLSLDDFAIFVADWEPKPDNLRRIAASLDLGLDALVFVDDRPHERDAVRQALPEIDVIVLPEDPAAYVPTLAAYPYFAMAAFTDEDSRRTDQYRARAQAAELESHASSIDEFLTSLEMRARIGEFDAIRLPRIVQLIGKTNQFNLTSRRHGRPEVEAMISDPDVVSFYVELADRFGDHGLVGVVIGRRHDETMEIDTFLMSCRVIGRSVEATILAEISRLALEMGCSRLEGIYRRTAKNKLVSDLYEKFGFEEKHFDSDGSVWIYDLDRGPMANEYITVERA